MDGRTDKWQLYFSTDDSMDVREVWTITEPGSNWNFVLEMGSSMLESPTVSQQTSESWIFTSMHRLLLSTWPKQHVKDSE